MAVAWTLREPAFNVWGRMKVNVLRGTLSGTYPTGGEELVPATYGVPEVIFAAVTERYAGTTGLVWRFDDTNNKVQAFEGSAAGTALSEKTNAEAYPTNAVIDVLLVGLS